MSRQKAASDLSADAPAMVGRDAVLYIPGLKDAGSTDGLERGARRIAEALDRQSVASYTLGGVQVEKLPRAGATRVITISRSDAGRPAVPMLDVYEVNYSGALSGGFAELKPVKQGIAILGLLLLCAPKLLRAIGKGARSFGHKLQVVYAVALFLLLAAYLPVVLATVASMVYTAVPGLPHYTIRYLDVGVDTLTRWLETAVVALTAAGFFTRFSLKDMLARFAGDFAPVLRYIAAGDRQGAVHGSVANLVNDIEDRQAAGGQAYGRLHVISYSFGSIVALDALFPRMQPIPLLARVDTLVTIGCPYDFVRTYYPRHFTGRKAASARLEWFNVYDPVDILSSTFEDRAHRKRRAARVGIGPENAAPVNLAYGQPASEWFEWIMLSGFRRHAQYWERMEMGDVSCFDMIVPHLYPATPPELAATTG